MVVCLDTSSASGSRSANPQGQRARDEDEGGTEAESDDDAQFDDQDNWASAVWEGTQSSSVEAPKRGMKGPKKSRGYFSDESASD